MAHLTQDLDKDTTYSYGPNSFNLQGLPAPRPGELLGLLGTHSIGKSTALKLLAGLLKPNLGRFTNPPEWQEILNHCRNRDRHLLSYFTHFREKQLKVAMKPQHVEDMRASIGPHPHVRKLLLDKHNERGMMKEICDELELNEFLDRGVHHLSDDLLQMVMIAIVASQKADVYIFDEPSSLLDVRQRFKAAQVIRYVIVADNDLSVLDYMSEAIYCFYGTPEAHGIVSRPYCVRSGIEVFLDGFDSRKKLRIRDESLIFEVARTPPPESFERYKYPNMSKTRWDCKLEVMAGEFTDCQVLVMLGERGAGKTTFLEMLAGVVPPDDEEDLELRMLMSYAAFKPQTIVWRDECTVRELPEFSLLLEDMNPDFISDVMKPLQIKQLMDRKVSSLSVAETHRVALTICLGKPGAYLDAELRLNAAMAIRRHVLRMEKAAIVVEHDLTMVTYMADQVIVFDKEFPTKYTANPPYPLVSGMNRFLSHLDITFRRNRMSFKFTPRVNKLGSIEDTRQKDACNYCDVVD